jgi:hypothetical protein
MLLALLSPLVAHMTVLMLSALRWMVFGICFVTPTLAVEVDRVELLHYNLFVKPPIYHCYGHSNLSSLEGSNFLKRSESLYVLCLCDTTFCFRSS